MRCALQFNAVVLQCVLCLDQHFGTCEHTGVVPNELHIVQFAKKNQGTSTTLVHLPLFLWQVPVVS